MPTYQQRFGHAPAPKPKHDSAIIAPKKKRVSQHLTRSAPLAQRESGIGTQPKHQAPMTALERQVFAHKRYLLSQELTRKNVAGAKPNAVGKFIGGIGQHPLGTLRDVTGIDVHRFEHPVRAIQQDRSRADAVGRQIQTGKLSLAEAAPEAGSAIFPGGGRIPGIGRLFGRTPKIEEPVSREVQIMREAMPAGKRAAAEQRKLIRGEKSERVASAMQAEQQAGGGLAGLQAAKGALRGEYSKVTFERLRKGNLSKADKDSLISAVDKHAFDPNPERNFFKRFQTKQAIENAYEHGEPPRAFENKLFADVFGEHATAVRQGLMGHVAYIGLDLLNIPRSIMSTLDVSFGGRQGIGALAAYPRIFGPNWARQFKLLVSEGKYQDAIQSIHAHPNYQMWKKQGLALTELPRKSERIAQREEYYPSSLIEKVPGPGTIVRASGRAFTGQADLTRLGIANHILEKARTKGVDVEDPDFLRATTRLANVLTGRGGLGKLQPAAPVANTVFFAPRLISSRLAMLNPQWYFSLYRMNPYVGREAAKAGIRLAALTGGALYGLNKLAGAAVGTDPTNADFLKAKFGTTRVDVMAGFQQYMRLAAQLYEGKVTSSTTGKTLSLGGGFAQMSRRDIALRFGEGKFNPTASLVDDFFRGSTFQGQPLTWKTEVLSRITPLVAQDTWDLYHSTNSVPFASLGYVISALGIGMQTYGPKKPKAKHYGGSAPSGGGSGGTDLFGGGGGAGGGGGTDLLGP